MSNILPKAQTLIHSSALTAPPAPEPVIALEHAPLERLTKHTLGQRRIGHAVWHQDLGNVTLSVSTQDMTISFFPDSQE